MFGLRSVSLYFKRCLSDEDSPVGRYLQLTPIPALSTSHPSWSVKQAFPASPIPNWKSDLPPVKCFSHSPQLSGWLLLFILMVVQVKKKKTVRSFLTLLFTSHCRPKQWGNLLAPWPNMTQIQLLPTSFPGSAWSSAVLSGLCQGGSLTTPPSLLHPQPWPACNVSWTQHPKLSRIILLFCSESSGGHCLTEGGPNFQ